MPDPLSIHAPVVSGSGAIVVHRALEAALPDYRVDALSPYWGLLPPALALRHRQAAAVTHTLPELGPRVAHPDSRLVVTFHGYSLDAELMAIATPAQRVFYRNLMLPAVRASLERAKWVTTVSRFTADLVQRHHALGERLVLVRNGVDTALFSPAARTPGDRVNILFAGNPKWRKGGDHLVALAAELPDGVVMQYTSGPRDLALKAGEASDRLVRISRRGHDEMPEVYRAADILFFPTRREGLSLVVLEAMACGLPVVATNCSSLPELIEHGKGGFLFEPDDRARMLDYLLRLSRDPALRAEMGAFNREKALTEFPLEKMIAGYREVFAA